MYPPPPTFFFCLRAMDFSWGVLDAVHKLMCSRLVRSLYFNRKEKKYTGLNHAASTPQCRSWVCPSDVSQERLMSSGVAVALTGYS